MAKWLKVISQFNEYGFWVSHYQSIETDGLPADDIFIQWQENKGEIDSSPRLFNFRLSADRFRRIPPGLSYDEQEEPKKIIRLKEAELTSLKNMMERSPHADVSFKKNRYCFYLNNHHPDFDAILKKILEFAEIPEKIQENIYHDMQPALAETGMPELNFKGYQDVADIASHVNQMSKQTKKIIFQDAPLFDKPCFRPVHTKTKDEAGLFEYQITQEFITVPYYKINQLYHEVISRIHRFNLRISAFTLNNVMLANITHAEYAKLNDFFTTQIHYLEYLDFSNNDLMTENKKLYNTFPTKDPLLNDRDDFSHETQNLFMSICDSLSKQRNLKKLVLKNIGLHLASEEQIKYFLDSLQLLKGLTVEVAEKELMKMPKNILNILLTDASKSEIKLVAVNVNFAQLAKAVGLLFQPTAPADGAAEEITFRPKNSNP